MRIRRIKEYVYEIPKSPSMLVPGRLIISDNLLKDIEEEAIEQVKKVASLPGIIGVSLGMPDIHTGYGFPIGGVAAFDAKKGIIAPGGIGFDINCGVRLIGTSINHEEIYKDINKILSLILKEVSVGVGGESSIKLSRKEFKELLKEGLKWGIRRGYGDITEIENCEEGGTLEGFSDLSVISQKALSRGIKQIGTLGSGNHFIEIQFVDKVYDKEIAKEFNLREGQVTIMIHTGSRGLGHQIAKDYVEEFKKAAIHDFPDKNLVYVPIQSDLAKRYLSAMVGAANFAWVNRQIIGFHTKEAIKKLFLESRFSLIYDVSHNIAKFEKYVINGKEVEVCVHRKGATRAFSKGNKLLPKKFRKIGQPVILPGSMGDYSYVLVSTNAESISFGSCAHGAGRKLSRAAAKKKFKGENIIKELKKNRIIVKTPFIKSISEEAPEAYKNVSEVVEVIEKVGIAKKVARLFPLGVVKG